MSCEVYPAIPVASFRSRKHFHRASKSSNETVTDWYARIHSMAESCQYGDASGILILDKFIIGLDDELFDRICTEVGYLSLEQSMKLAIQIEEEFNILPKDNVDVIKLEYVHPKEEVQDVAESELNNYAEPLDTFESTYRETDSEPSSDSDENLSQRRKRKVKLRKSKRKDVKHKTDDAGSDDEIYPEVKHDTTHEPLTILIEGRNAVAVESETVTNTQPSNAGPKTACPKPIEKKGRGKNRVQRPKEDDTEKTFECTFCHKILSNKGNLARHVRFHLNEKLFTCHYCGKSYHLNNDLKKHMRIHTGERPFVCVVCQKSFTRSDTLKLHVNTHAGIKPHACSVCGKQFSQKVQLITHMRIHTGERPFKCQICQKGFTNSTGLTAHLKVHRTVWSKINKISTV